MVKQPLILLVEDREDDVLLIRRAFERAKVDSALQVVPDGTEAIAYLSGEGIFSNRAEFPLPWLVLLDLKMPKVDGFEVLQWIRGREGLHSLVVVVLTSSEQMKDVNRAYALGANSFMVKPLDFENTVTLAQQIQHYWLQWNRLPESARQPRRKSEKGSETNGGHKT